MSTDDGRIERLGRTFRAPSERAEAASGCPDADTLRSAASLDAPPRGRREVLDHVAVCPACAVAWETVREIAATSTVAPRAAAPALGRTLTSLAAAAVLALAFVLLPDSAPDRARGGVWRTTASAIDWTGVRDETALSQDGGRLAWPAGPEGTRYRVRVTTVDLETLANADGLVTTSWKVPAESVASLAPGTVVLWQVVASTPDGRTATSPTFRARIGPPAP